jgi:uncharacterized protein YuzE
MKFKTLEEIQSHPIWIKLQSKGTDKHQLDEQFLSLSEEEKIIAIDLFESLKVVMENIIKEKLGSFLLNLILGFHVKILILKKKMNFFLSKTKIIYMQLLTRELMENL